MDEYCRSYVDILRRGCACFRKILIDISGVDPFTESCTIAQTCSKVWRKNYMPEDCIASFHQKDTQTRRTIQSKLWDGSRAKQRKMKLRLEMPWMVEKKRFVVITSTDTTNTQRQSSHATGTDAQHIFQTEIGLIHTTVEASNNFTQKLFKRNWR